MVGGLSPCPCNPTHPQTFKWEQQSNFQITTVLRIHLRKAPYCKGQIDYPATVSPLIYNQQLKRSTLSLSFHLGV